MYIADAHLNLLGGSEISSVLNPLVSQLTDSADLLPTTIHLTPYHKLTRFAYYICVHHEVGLLQLAVREF